MPYNGCWQWPAHHTSHSTLLWTLWHHIAFGRPVKISGSYAIPWPHLEPSHWEGRHQSQPDTCFLQEKSQRQPRETEETSLHRHTIWVADSKGPTWYPQCQVSVVVKLRVFQLCLGCHRSGGSWHDHWGGTTAVQGYLADIVWVGH